MQHMSSLCHLYGTITKILQQSNSLSAALQSSVNNINIIIIIHINDTRFDPI